MEKKIPNSKIENRRVYSGYISKKKKKHELDFGISIFTTQSINNKHVFQDINFELSI